MPAHDSKIQSLPRQVENLTGRRFGRLVVVEFAGVRDRKATWLCHCDCGNSHIVRSNCLKKGATKSCGCLKDCFKNMIGLHFGRYTVIEFAEVRNGNSYLRCQCDCGNIRIVSATSLKRGNTKSCGRSRCSHRFQDLTGQRFERLVVECIAQVDSAKTMWQRRCDCGHTVIVAQTHLKRGLTKSCGCYKKDVHTGTNHHIDGNGTHAASTRTLTWNGMTKTIKEWSEHYNINFKTICYRIRVEWPINRVLGEPARKRGRFREFKD